MKRNRLTNAARVREFLVQLAVSIFLAFIYGLILICH